MSGLSVVVPFAIAIDNAAAIDAVLDCSFNRFLHPAWLSIFQDPGSSEH